MNIAVVIPLFLVHRSHENRPVQSAGLATNRLRHSTPVWHFHPSMAIALSIFSKDFGSLDALINSPASQQYRPADGSATGLPRCMTTSGEADEDAGGSLAETIWKLSNHQVAGELKKGDSNSHSRGQLSPARLQNTLVLKMKKAASIFPLGLDLQGFWTAQEGKVSMVSGWELMDLLSY